jgi:hypothetical protein
MATNSWRGGGSGNWSTGLSWSLFQPPQAGDEVFLAGNGPYTVTVDIAAAARDIFVSAAGATLDVANSLALGGTLGVSAGSALIVAGTITGGTIDSASGIVGQFGTLDGTAVTAGTTLSDLAITTRTAAANIGTTLDAGQSLSLAGGTYATTTFLVDMTGAGGGLATDGAGAVTFAANTTVTLFENPALLTSPMTNQTATLSGGGGMVNLGTISSNYSNTDGGTLAITVASFTNDNQLDFTPLMLPESGTFIVGYQQLAHGTIPIQGMLSWTQGFAEALDIGSASFTNNGTLSVAGGTLDLTGAGFNNTGVLQMIDVAAQQVTSDAQGVASVIDVALTTLLDVGAATTFGNSGTISADTIDFAGAVTLASLGTLNGTLIFAGGLDLGGGTLDIAQSPTVTLSGLVRDGGIGPGLLVLDAATLDNVAIDPAATVQAIGPITLIDPPPAVTSVTLDGTTTELQFSAGVTTDIAVVAGTTQTTDLIRVADTGQVTFGAGFTGSDTLAGSTLEIGGFGTLDMQGALTLDASSLLLASTLDGTGSIVMSDSAAVTIDALASTAATTITFGAGPTLLVLPGSGAFGISFVGLHAGDVIDFSSISSVPDGLFGNGGAVQQDGTLFVTGASGQGAIVASADAPNDLNTNVTPDGSGGTLLVVETACFLEGTLLATPDGEVPVQRVRPGDVVRTLAGRLAPVRWVGHTRVDVRRHPRPERAAPIRLRAGALANGVPRRDLLVSPEHCFLIDGALVPAFLLVNGATIARDDGWAEITYWHVELDRHDILLAEGAAAESYLDTGNRALFAGEAGTRALHRDFADRPDDVALGIWREHGCAPLLLDAAGPRARLLDRARALGWRHSEAPALAVLAGGRRLPLTRVDSSLRLRAPAGVTALRLLSDSFVPAEVLPGSGDMRRLGVAVASARLAGWDLHPDAFAEGWHPPRDEAWRWSDGAATIALPKLTRATDVDIRLAAAGIYWHAPGQGPTDSMVAAA